MMKRILAVLAAVALAFTAAFAAAAPASAATPTKWPSGNVHPNGNCMNDGYIIYGGPDVPLTGLQVLDLWHDREGLTGGGLRAMVAVAWLESHNCRKAYNGRGADDSYGLMQFNVKDAKWAERKVWCGLTSKAQLYDAVKNVQCADELRRRQGYTAWSTYNTADYWAIMPWVNSLMNYRGYPLT